MAVAWSAALADHTICVGYSQTLQPAWVIRRPHGTGTGLAVLRDRRVRREESLL